MDTETLAQRRIFYPASMGRMEYFEFYHASGFRFHVLFGRLIHMARPESVSLIVKGLFK